MKKSSFLMLGVLCVVCGMAAATPVDSLKARMAAQAFIRANGSGAKSADLTDISSKTQFDEFYVFTFNGGNGFVLVSGDDATEPILGYSDNSRFVAESLPQHIVDWLRGYEEAIVANRVAAAGSKAAHSGWAQLLGGNAKESKAIVGPFISSRWDQGAQISAQCPFDTTANRLVPCGCTATATAQIMRYWHHPAKGYGEGSYVHPVYGEQHADYGNTTNKWDAKPDTLNSYSSDAQIDAVSTLVHQIGVAVHMDYKPSGSGGKTASYGNGGEPSAENILKYNFGYSPNVRTLFRCDYDVKTWRAYMKAELDARRPVLYAGYAKDQSGHAFVLDGYMTGGKFHFNWGWGGVADGYFTIDALNPSAGGGRSDFNYFATATLGIEPYETYTMAGTTNVMVAVEGIRGAADTDGEVAGAGNYNCGDTVTLVAKAKHDGVRFVQWSDGCRSNPRSTVATGGVINLTAQFAPLRSDTVFYNTCDNTMMRDSRVTPRLGTDSVWGIKLPASALRRHHNLSEVHFMGSSTDGKYTLTVYSGNDAPEDVLYTEKIEPNFMYSYSWYAHKLTTPVVIEADKPIWIALKCTNLEKPAVFSIYGGNSNGMLAGEQLTTLNDSVLYSWMIRAVFKSDGVGIEEADDISATVYPNPAADYVTVTLPSNDKPYRMQIIDCNGRVVMEKEATSTLRFYTGALQRGIYYVRLSDDKTSKVLKMVR